ncbi:MAG: hypothetical protein GTO18_00335 [Anaerolineales bacterium]|nr:hypothetical protein [Anaerolineales bacterium]
MKERKTIPVGVLFMIMVLALASLGVGYGLWSKTLVITGEVRTGDVHAMFMDAFTDDDDKVDNPDKDSQDTDECIDLGDVDRFTEGDDNPISGFTSCDPAASGKDIKPHYDKDVAACVAEILDPQTAKVTKYNVYPSYYCTAWFDILNDGSIPVKVQSVKINGQPVRPSVITPFDLDDDELADVEIHVSEIKVCQQIEPNELVQMDIDQHVLQEAPQGGTLNYTVEVLLHQWNEGCKVLLYYGNSGIGPGSAFGYPGSDGELFSLKSHYEGMSFAVDYTDTWPTDLSIYRLVVLYGPGNEDDTDDFTAAQVAELSDYMKDGGRVVVVTDWNNFAGTSVPNNLLTNLGIGIQKRTPTTYATPDGDSCAPLTVFTPDQLTNGLASLDPAATTPLDLSGSAVSLARVDDPPYTCGVGVKHDATWIAVDQVAGAPARPGSDLIVIGDANILDDTYGFGDPSSDGMSGAALGTKLIDY